MRIRFRLALPCFLVAAAVSAFAALRAPTPAEQTAIDKYAKTVNKVLDQFRSDDWDENIDYAIDDVSVNTNDPGVPLDINELTQRTYTVRNGSQRFNEKIAPSMQQLMSSSDMNAKVKIGQQMQSLMRMQVQVHFNRANLGFEPAPANNHDLHIPGAAFAYKIDDSAFGHGLPTFWRSAIGTIPNGTRNTAGITSISRIRRTRPTSRTLRCASTAPTIASSSYCIPSIGIR